MIVQRWLEVQHGFFDGQVVVNSSKCRGSLFLIAVFVMQKPILYMYLVIRLWRKQYLHLYGCNVVKVFDSIPEILHNFKCGVDRGNCGLRLRAIDVHSSMF